MMRHGMRFAWLPAILLISSATALGPGCGSASEDGLFGAGGSLGGSSQTTGGVASITGGTTSGSASASGGSGGIGVGGSSGSFGSGGEATGGAPGDEPDAATRADGATGGFAGATGGFAGMQTDGSTASGGTGGATIEDASSDGTGPIESGAGGVDSGGGIGNGVQCGNDHCDRDDQCCVTSDGDYCSPAGTPCDCASNGCTTTSITCDEPTDCDNGSFCCFTVVYTSTSIRVSSLNCQPTCSAPLTQYILCDPARPEICPTGTSCSTALLMPGLNACQ